MRRLVRQVLAALLLCAIPAAARAILYIDINSPGGTRMPIAVPDFVVVSGDSSLAGKIPGMLSSDLEMTGLFDLIPSIASLEKVVPSHFTGTPLSFPDWKIIGAEAVVIGRVEARGDQVTVEMRLYDATLGKMMAGKRYTAAPARLRLVVHKFANEILYAFTGTKGIFDTEVAFSAHPQKGSRGKEVFVVGLDGQGLRQVTGNRSFNLFPRWSPDGGTLAFTSFRTGAQEILLKNLQDGKERAFVNFGNTKAPGSFSPDGKYLYISVSIGGNSDIYRAPLVGGPSELVEGGWGLEVSPSVSPDGKMLAFVSNRSGSPQVYVKDLAGGGVQRISAAGGYCTSPAWSPAGGLIAFTAQAGGKFSVYTVRPDGSDQKVLVSEDGDAVDPSFSPDGRYIVYSFSKKSYSELRMVSVDGRWKRSLFFGLSGLSSPAWSPRR